MKTTQRVIFAFLSIAAAVFAFAVLAWIFGSGGLWIRLQSLAGFTAAACILAGVLQCIPRQTRVIFCFVIGLVLLAGLFFPTAWLVGFTQGGAHMGYENLFAILIFILPILAFIAAAALLNSGLHLLAERNLSGDQIQPPQAHPGSARIALACLVLSGLLVIKTLYNLYWLFVWDSTYDSLDILWLILPFLTVFFAGLFLTVSLPEKTKWFGLVFLLLIPGLLAADFTLAKMIDFRQASEIRAGRVELALQAYHAREGRYPPALRQLVPRYILNLSEPVILYGQDWCYQGGDDFYRLGYVTRGHWSDPNLVGWVFTEDGTALADIPALCATEIAALQKSNPFFTQSR